MAALRKWPEISVRANSEQKPRGDGTTAREKKKMIEGRGDEKIQRDRALDSGDSSTLGTWKRAMKRQAPVDWMTS